QSQGLYHVAPASLVARIEQLSSAHNFRFGRASSSFWAGALARAALAAMITVVIGLALLRGRGGDDLVLRDICSAHIRSLMPGHLTDVASTDQHTVKPWFDGRIDYAPPVCD